MTMAPSPQWINPRPIQIVAAPSYGANAGNAAAQGAAATSYKNIKNNLKENPIQMCHICRERFETVPCERRSEMEEIVRIEIIEQKIFMIRGHKVMLDRDLASLYGVKTMVLNQAVKRNINRFPQDFMFQLSKKEMENWISQIVISNKEKMGIRRKPCAFTEQASAY